MKGKGKSKKVKEEKTMEETKIVEENVTEEVNVEPETNTEETVQEEVTEETVQEEVTETTEEVVETEPEVEVEEPANEPEETTEEVVETEPEVVEEIQNELVKGVLSGCEKLYIRKEADKKSAPLMILDKTVKFEINLNNSTEAFYNVITSTGINGYCVKEFIKID